VGAEIEGAISTDREQWHAYLERRRSGLVGGATDEKRRDGAQRYFSPQHKILRV
jgi:hypothetical protein